MHNGQQRPPTSFCFDIRPAGSFLLALMLAGAPASVHAAEATELAGMLPQSANMIAVVRVADILQTPRAKSEGWAETSRRAFLSGAVTIPPWVDTLVMGALVRPEVPEEVWTAAVLTVPESVTMERIAQREHADVEQLAGRPAVRCLHDVFVVRLAPGTLGVLSPAFRQATSRWIRAIDQRDLSPINAYLSNAAGRDEHIVVALDLQDMFDPERVAGFVGAMPEFENQPSAVKELALLVGDLVGVTLTVEITEVTTAEIRFEFNRPPGTSAENFKPLFLAVLNQSGAALDDLDEAPTAASGNSVVPSAELSDAGLRRVMSLLLAPAPSERAAADVQAVRGETPETPSSVRSFSQSAELDASRDYFHSVNQTIDDLQRANRRAKEYARTATWHENFAKKIDRLPVGGVDEKLLAYGSRTSQRFRALAASLRGVAIDMKTQERAITYDVRHDPGWAAVNIWGGVGGRMPSWRVDSNLKEVRERQAEAIAAGAKQRDEVWQLIDNDRAEVERAMRNQYGDSFMDTRRRR